MSYAANEYPVEKAPLVDVEALPTFIIQEKRPSVARRFVKTVFAVFSVFFILSLFRHGPSYAKLSRGCHGIISGSDDGGHQHPFPPGDKWVPYKGTTHFELEPAEASGFTVKGTQAFGKVIFETSKLSDKVVIDLDIKTNKVDQDNDISVEEKDGYITVDTTSAKKLKTRAAAKILIPSNIIGTFGLESFELDLPRHMVDYSALPKSLEIGEFTIRLGKGFVKPGAVHTNTTTITIAQGALHGSLTQARHETSINVAKGNVTLDISDISSGNEGVSNIKLGDGHLKGSLPVYNSTTVDVAKGSIYLNVDFESASEENRAELSTKVGSGPARVYVDSIAANRLFKAYHTSISGDQMITYPDNFQGTIDARGLAGSIKLEGEDVIVEKVLGGLQGKKGDSERNYVSVKAAKGALDILVGDRD